MDIGVALLELGEFNVQPLSRAIMALDDAAWLGNEYRQDNYEVHEQTQSIVLVFTDGSGWGD